MEQSAQRQGYWDHARETRSWDERRTELNRHLRDIVALAAKSSPAYQEMFKQAGLEPGDIKDIDDLGRLPVLHMEDLVRRQKQDPPFGGFCTVDLDQVHRIYVNPGLIWQPGPKRSQDTSWTQALAAAGFGASDIAVNTFNYHLWPYAFILDESLARLGGTVVPTGTGNTMMQVRIIKSLGVTGFMGTPSFLMTLAQRAEGMGLDPKKDLKLERAQVGAEMLPESLRKRIEDKLGISVRQAYGTVFLGCLGFECSELGGLHVPDNLIVEVVDPASEEPVAPGAPGEVVATSFNPEFPLIRMGTGDLSLMSEGDCVCGRRGPRLKKVLGRIDEACKVQGTFVHPWQTDEVVARFKEVFKYQVSIEREGLNDVMTFKVELVDDTVQEEALAPALARAIKEVLTIRGRVEVVPRGNIPDFHKKIIDERSWE